MARANGVGGVLSFPVGAVDLVQGNSRLGAWRDNRQSTDHGTSFVIACEVYSLQVWVVDVYIHCTFITFVNTKCRPMTNRRHG